jgi:malonate transporter and related proteins
MLDTILGALLPMVVTFLLGFVAAWRRDFGPKDAAILNRMVLHYAVPLLLFAGTVSTPRAELSQDMPLLIALCVAIIGLYGVVLLLSRFAFRRRMSVSALAGLTASAPAVPFSAVLGPLFGGLIAAIPIAIASLVINLTVMPVTILLLTLDTAGDESQGTSPSKDRGHSASPRASPPAPSGSVLAAKLAETVKEPIVWAPVLAFVIVLSGAGIPQLIVHSLSVLGCASGGVALFASGIVLASATIKVSWYVLFLVFLKNIVQPALVLGGLRWLGYGNPIVSEVVLMTAIPAMPMVIMLAVQYRALEAEAPSAVFLSVIGSVITIGAFIALTS